MKQERWTVHSGGVAQSFWSIWLKLPQVMTNDRSSLIGFCHWAQKMALTWRSLASLVHTWKELNFPRKMSTYPSKCVQLHLRHFTLRLTCLQGGDKDILRHYLKPMCVWNKTYMVVSHVTGLSWMLSLGPCREASCCTGTQTVGQQSTTRIINQQTIEKLL